MAFDPELATRQLIGVYRDAYVRLLETIATAEAKGNATAFQRGLLRDVGEILTGLDATAEQWAKEVIPQVYQGGIDLVNEAWAKVGPQTLQAGFAQVHRAAVDVLVSNFTAEMSDAHRFMARHVRDEWRRAALDTLSRKVATGQTVKDAAKSLRETVAERGLGAFVDKAGRTWDMPTYTNMVARTTTAEATNLGTMNQMRGLGHDLVKMTEHNHPCKICAAYEGRVYSVSGEDTRFPWLGSIPGYKDQYQTLHPNCSHRVTPWVEPLQDDVEGEIKRSNRPFKDERSEREIRQYERGQKRNRLRRERQKLERQVQVLPPGDERDKLRDKLRDVRSKQRELGKQERLDVIDEGEGASA